MACWYRVDLPLSECCCNGKADQLQKAFDLMYVASQKPRDAALFEWHDDTLQGSIFFFTPAAAALIKPLLEEAGAWECGPPILSDRLVLLVGHPGTREAMAR